MRARARETADEIYWIVTTIMRERASERTTTARGPLVNGLCTCSCVRALRASLLAGGSRLDCCGQHFGPAARFPPSRSWSSQNDVQSRSSALPLRSPVARSTAVDKALPKVHFHLDTLFPAQSSYFSFAVDARQTQPTDARPVVSALHCARIT